MYYSGFADEAGASLDAQISATWALGWSDIEARKLFDGNLGSITDAQFDELQDKLAASGVRVNCYGSAVANWAKSPRKPEDHEASVEELRKALPRMAKLGCKMLRGMSYQVPKDEAPDSPEIEAIIFKKVNELAKMCEDAGVLYLHENCMNYGGLSHVHTLRLVENIKSPAFKLVFDTGNPVFTDDRSKGEPRPRQSAWEFYQNVKPHIHYIHIKDGYWDCKQSKPVFTFPGDGQGDVRCILKDLLASGYDGGISIEPHMVAIHHDAASNPAGKAKAMFENYVDYGRRTMRMVEEIKAELRR